MTNGADLHTRTHFSLLKHYSEFRKTQADLFKVTADELADVLGKGIVAVLPQRDKNGCTIVLVRSGQIKLEETPFKVLLRALIYICEKLIEDFTVQINGNRIIYFTLFTCMQKQGSSSCTTLPGTHWAWSPRSSRPRRRRPCSGPRTASPSVLEARIWSTSRGT